MIITSTKKQREYEVLKDLKEKYKFINELENLYEKNRKYVNGFRKWKYF
jgi:hypothetical protein